MAIWQFDMHMIPLQSVEDHFGLVPILVSREDFDRYDWWTPGPAEGIATELSRLLPTTPSWSESVRIWGEMDGNRVDMVSEGSDLLDVFVRVDARVISYQFLSQLCDLAQKYDCLLLTEGGYVIRPSLSKMLASIARSNAFKFVSDPDGFIRELSRLERPQG
jgi:hypothetical protein